MPQPARQPLSTLHLLTVSTRPAKYFDAFLASARAAGFEPAVLGEGLEWRGCGMKLRLVRRHLESLADSALVLFADAHDSLIVHAPAAIVDKYRRLGSPIVFSAEKNCWPDPWKAPYFPEKVSPWRFLNSGGFLGEAGPLLDVFAELSYLLTDDYDDQRWWTDCYLANHYLGRNGRIRLDTRCEIFQSLWSSDEDIEVSTEVRNRLTGTTPSVLHGNGGVDLSSLIAWLDERPSRAAGAPTATDASPRAR